MTVLDATDEQTVLIPTPNDDGRPRRFADFNTFCEALDFAANGACGFNFHDARGCLAHVYPYRALRRDALLAARRLIALGVKPADRVALIAETSAEFAALFCGAMYAGAWPVPLPLPTSFGGKENYIDQLAVQIASSDPAILLYPGELESICGAAAARCNVPGMTWQGFMAAAPASEAPLPAPDPDAISYLQYSSGSTRFPHGVAITHRALLANLAGHAHGMAFQPGDRAISWLPWYHDMGLVGCFLSPIANQFSVDYLRPDGGEGGCRLCFSLTEAGSRLRAPCQIPARLLHAKFFRHRNLRPAPPGPVRGGDEA